MNFLNFLSSGAKFFNFNLNSTQYNGHNLFQSNQSPAVPTTQVGFKDNKVEPIKQDIPLLQTNNIKPEKIKKTLQTNEIIGQMLLNQQQQLFNQYLHLNLQLINKKYESQTTQKLQHQKVQNQSESIHNQKKKIKKTNRCGHQDKQHYAKGLCNNCYHKYGRTKKPWNCPHQKLYASGMCQNCYINRYNKNKRTKQSQKIMQEKNEKDSQKI